MLVPKVLFFQPFFSPPLRHPVLLSVPRRALDPGQLPASASLCASWDGGRSQQAVGLVPGGLLHPWGLQHRAGGDVWQGPSWHQGLWPVLCQDLLSSCSQLCPRHLAWPSTLELGGISQQLRNVPKLKKKKKKSQVRNPPSSQERPSKLSQSHGAPLLQNVMEEKWVGGPGAGGAAPPLAALPKTCLAAGPAPRPPASPSLGPRHRCGNRRGCFLPGLAGRQRYRGPEFRGTC